MILPKSWMFGIIFYIILPESILENTGPTYDTSDWIPIVPDNAKSTNRESKSSDRILNIGISEEKFIGEQKLPVKKTYVTPHKPRKNPHIKRSPNQRPRIKLEQPYRFENILSPPPKQHVRGFQQKIPYQQNFNLQPQYQFQLPKPSHIVSQESYHQQFPSNPSIYNLNNLQSGRNIPNIPNYSSSQLGITYQQQPNLINHIPTTNNTNFQHSSASSINQGLFETTLNQNSNQNVKLPSQVPSEEKDTVQLLYVPLEQLQKQQGIDSGILDEAFKSLQQQKLVAPPPESDLQLKESEAAQSRPQQNIQQQNFHQQNINQQKYRIQQNQPTNKGEEQGPTQYYVLQNEAPQKRPEQPTYYELVSKNQGELILQNNPKTVEVSNKQEYQVQAEKQQIIELTSPGPISNHQSQYNSPFEYQLQQRPQDQYKDTRIQDSRDFVKKEPQSDQSSVVQNQLSQPFSVEAPRLQQSYIVQNQPQAPAQQNYFQDAFETDQKSRLQSIQKDILQQTLQVEKLQKQIQQGKSIDFRGKNTSQPPKKRKPHQPPLAVYMEGNQPGDVDAVLEVLKNAKSIAVQDQIGPNSPQVFIGPSNLNVPDGFAKFPLPYLSNLDNNRIQRKAQQFPFFVAPLNYKEPEGYSKIPLPTPHVGSVVIKQNQIQNLNDNFEEINRPVAITNYKFVNPSFESVVDSNSHFDDNLNAYSLESGNPRDNPNRHLKEQTLLQQITGFSGFDFPQTQYFTEGRPSAFGQEQIPTLSNQNPTLSNQNPTHSNQHPTHSNQNPTHSSTPQTTRDQYLEEAYRKPASESPEEVHQEIPSKITSPPSSRQRTRGERIRGSKKGGNTPKEVNEPERSEKSTERNVPNFEAKLPEVPTPNIVQAPEKVEISSQNPLTQDFLNRFSSNNNFNFNYVSSTPGYAIPSQTSAEELPANIRKLNVKPTQDITSIRNQQAIDAQFEQSIQSSQNSREKITPNQEERRVHVYNQYEQYELPPQLTNINPNLPGLINELEQENQYTTSKYETASPVSTTQSTPEYTVRTTEATTTTTTTTRRPRGRGRSRFNMKTTTSSPYRRNQGERRRPSKTTVATTTEASYGTNEYTATNQNERTRPRTRLQNTLTERVAEGSIESTSTSHQLLQPNTRVMDISQNQPNYFVEFQSSIANVKPILRDEVEEPKTETVRVVEQYQSQKVTTAEELASQVREQSPIPQISVTQPDRSEQVKPEINQRPSAEEKPTRKRVRVRGRPKNKYSSTTIAPRYTSPPEKEETEFYGFIRQPNFSQSSQISNNNRNEENNLHIYAPTQQKSPIYNQRNNEPIGPSTSRADTESPRFVGELRPKYASPSRGTTTQLPETTQRSRIRGRVRVPGRTYENKSRASETSSTERNSRGRVRGKMHFTPPRSLRQEVENDETENYPASFLKSREAATTPSSSEFKITVSTDDEQEDQIPYSSLNKHEKLPTEDNHNFGVTQEGSKNLISNEEYEAAADKMEIVSFRDKQRDANTRDGFRVVNLDQFDTAESQNYRTFFNSLDSPYKVNDLKSREIEESSSEAAVNTSEPIEPENATVPAENITENTENVFPTTTEISESERTSLDDLNSTILESVRETIGNSTTPISPTTTPDPTMATTTEDFIRETKNTSAEESTESFIVTTTLNPEETTTSTETKIPEQTPLDLLLLQTSTSTEISHETEICYKGRCVKSKNKKFRKRLLRKKTNETDV
ncbi:uncharacterized protein LOC123307544 [Coccinella septempunctata]|uniref:uncharacterized protein LOC123307544 n=1 Tax=Coccinella septempunctata TaxID=41139 RepID=UPI001D07B592|nr:uncharacterized protein LOC123307544 [Coccinella septempunctata]